jgi:plastocyanin
MTPNFLAPLVAALALGASPALAQHGGHPHDAHADAQERAAKASAAHGIVEGTVTSGVRVVEVAVTEEGFVPSKVKAKKGEKVRFVITRNTDSTCAREIVIAEHGINQPLPLGKTVTVEFTPKQSGEIRYACGMNHVAGVVFIP